MAPACHHDLEDTRRARGVGGTSGRKRAKKVLALELMTGHGMAAGVLLTQAPARKADRPPPRVTLQNRRGRRASQVQTTPFVCVCVCVCVRVCRRCGGTWILFFTAEI